MAITILCCHSVILYRVHFAISGIRTHALIAKCKSNYHTVPEMSASFGWSENFFWASKKLKSLVHAILDGGRGQLSKLCPVTPTSIQDGRHQQTYF